MQLFMSHLMGRLLRVFPKHRLIRLNRMQARFFVPVNSHYICQDLRALERGTREPELYTWLSGMPEDAVYFDVGTSYGQEVALASSLEDKNIRVVGFDCGLYHGHFCALNKTLNADRFQFVFAAVAETTGKLISITSNSDTHIPPLHKKNVPYCYEVMTLALDDFARTHQLYPTHLKIDVDGAERGVLKGAQHILKTPTLQQIFIEVDNENKSIVKSLEKAGFEMYWQKQRTQNADMLFKRK